MNCAIPDRISMHLLAKYFNKTYILGTVGEKRGGEGESRVTIKQLKRTQRTVRLREGLSGKKDDVLQ